MTDKNCDYDGCDSNAEYYDGMDNHVCEPCMLREIEHGADPESYERIIDHHPKIGKTNTTPRRRGDEPALGS